MDEDVDGEMLYAFNDLLDEILKYDCTPPALSTSGGRRVFKRLSDAADVDTSDDLKDYITLYGGRRGAREMYYLEASDSAA